MAEAIFNNLSKSSRAESAGVEKAEGIDVIAKKLLEKRGYKVLKEKPRTIDEVNLEDFNLIIAVCDESCVYIPKAIRWQIRNPAGKDEEEYKKVLEVIEEKVKALLEEIE